MWLVCLMVLVPASMGLLTVPAAAVAVASAHRTDFPLIPRIVLAPALMCLPSHWIVAPLALALPLVRLETGKEMVQAPVHTELCLD